MTGECINWDVKYDWDKYISHRKTKNSVISDLTATKLYKHHVHKHYTHIHSHVKVCVKGRCMS